MERKSLIITIAVMVVFVIAVVYALSASGVIYFKDKYNISGKDVESIVVTKQGRNEYHTLNIEDTEKFIKLYNESSYDGEGTGEGGTAEYGVLINLKGGQKLYIYDFSGKDFEVSLRSSDTGETIEWYYVSSNEFKTFVEELIAINFV